MTSNLLLSQMEDVLCLFIYSVMPGELLPTDFVLEPSHPAFPSNRVEASLGFSHPQIGPAPSGPGFEEIG